MSESKTIFHKETEDGYRECPDPSSVCGWGPQDRCYLTTTDNQGNNVKIMSPVSATIASIEIKDPDYRNRTPVFITIHFDDGSVYI